MPNVFKRHLWRLLKRKQERFLGMLEERVTSPIIPNIPRLPLIQYSDRKIFE